MFETVRLARWLAYCTLAVAFVAILAGCSGDSTAPGPTTTETESTESTATVEATHTPTPTPTPTPEPQLDTINLDGQQSFLGQIPEEERKCLLFSLGEDRVRELLDRRGQTTTGEFQIVTKCLSSSTTKRAIIGLVQDAFDLSKESSACFADRLATIDPVGAMIALEMINVDPSRRPAQ